jgi:ATP-binding cassette subfamily B protein
MGRLRGYVLRYRRRYALGAVCLLGTATLVMWIPWWIREAVRILEEGGALDDVTFYAVIIAAAAVVQGVIRTWSRSLIFNAGRDIEYDLRGDLFAHLQKLPMAYYHSQRTGDLMSRVINDIAAVRMLLGPGFLNFVNAPLYYVYALALMISIDWRMTLAALAPYPILIWAVRNFRGKILRGSLRVQEQMAELSNHIQENISGVHVVKAYTQEDPQARAFVALNEEYRGRSVELAALRGVIEPFMRGMSGLAILTVLWYGGVRVIRGDLLIADVVAFIAYLNVLAWPTAAFGWMLSLIERGRAAMKRLEEIFKTEPDITNPLSPARSVDLRLGVEFSGVSFAYGTRGNGRPTLKDIDFALPLGRTVALVGRTGAGKTTLAQLVPRLYDVSAGEIRLGGRDIRQLELAELRQALAYVPQDSFLFSDTLRRNLTFGKEDVPDAEVEKVVRLTRLDRDVETFPHGLDTIVGERGVTLSGGQKQRATLARALLCDAPFLILDDCLSSVDAHTEDEILRGLREVLKERTCLIVSHRISAIREADEILVMDEGEIVEGGSHDELVSRGGLYADMFRQQQLSEEMEQL